MRLEKIGCPDEMVLPNSLALNRTEVSIINSTRHAHTAALLHDFLFSKENQELRALRGGRVTRHGF